MATIKGLIRHLRHGTTVSRIRQEFEAAGKLRRCQQWNSGSVEEIETVIAPGVSLTVFTHDVLSRLIYCQGFELSERRFMQNFLRAGDVFIDVGANIGLFSIIASAIVGDRGRVYAFEPADRTYRRLLQNSVRHGRGNVECVQMAVSDEPGRVELHVSEDGRDAWNTIGHPASMGGESLSTSVEAVRLDDFVAQKSLETRVTMIKIDVEGWEGSVLKGGVGFLSSAAAPLLQVEFTDEAARSAGSSCAELYEMLTSLGYAMYEYDAHANRLIESPRRDSYPYVNLYAIKDVDGATKRLQGH